MVIYRIIRWRDQLRASIQAKYLQLEQAVFEALCELWPQPERHTALRMAAMMSVGALRLALDPAKSQSAVVTLPPVSLLTE